VVVQYPNSAKVPDALLKLGYIEADMQNSVKAREYLLRVTNNYPNSPAAHLAAKKLAQMP
jgi:TolA-binding protein